MEIRYKNFAMVKSPVCDEWVAWAGIEWVASASSYEALQVCVDAIIETNEKQLREAREVDEYNKE